MNNVDDIEVLESDRFLATAPAPPPPPPPQTTWQKFKKTIYNRDNRQFFGKTFLGWVRLGLFYLVFYGFLAGIIAGCLSGLFYTLDLNEPKWKLQESLIGNNPGLGFRPISLESGALISYSLEKPATSEKWVKLLDEFLEPYQKLNRETYYQNCSFYKKTKSKSLCSVDVDHFGPCAGEKKYGYNTSSPCVFIKLNKIFGWVPKFYVEPVKDMPVGLIKSIKKLPRFERNQIWISCNGVDPTDKENVKGFNYYPGMGLPGYFYPYLNVKNYLSPLIAVHILDPTPNLIIYIECRAWASNIYYKGGDSDRQGSVTFEIFIDKNQ